MLAEYRLSYPRMLYGRPNCYRIQPTTHRPHTACYVVGPFGGYPPPGWFALRTDSISLLVPAPWVTHINPMLLDALGIDTRECVTVYGENAVGDVTDVVDDAARVPPELDPAFRVYHVSGSPNGQTPSAGASGVDGAFFKQRDGMDMDASEGAAASGAERTGLDFTKQRHGRLFSFLAHGIVPQLSPVPGKKLTRLNRRLLGIKVMQWKQNANRRYTISEDGHLVYLAHKRKRTNVVRNIRLTMNPHRIIPFADEIAEVPLHALPCLSVCVCPCRC
jgi:hypothetical protein